MNILNEIKLILADRPQLPDGSHPLLYRASADLHLALSAALVTRRPLLLRGDPGIGKSTFARWVAANFGWKFLKYVVTSRSKPRDLLYQWDAVRRLADAHTSNSIIVDADYVRPGPFWWAVQSNPAACLEELKPQPVGSSAESKTEDKYEPQHGIDSPTVFPGEYFKTKGEQTGDGTGSVPEDGAVLLIDEIDKADVDFPNDLLDPMDTFSFQIDELPGRPTISWNNKRQEAQLSDLLIVITTNGERDLPPAFLRRCLVMEIIMPKTATLVEIAKQHFKSEGANDVRLYNQLAARVEELRKESVEQGGRGPAIAEYLDAIRACKVLNIDPLASTPKQPQSGNKAENPAAAAPTPWDIIEALTLRKSQP